MLLFIDIKPSEGLYLLVSFETGPMHPWYILPPESEILSLFFKAKAGHEYDYRGEIDGW